MMLLITRVIRKSWDGESQSRNEAHLRTAKRRHPRRRGAVAVLAAILLVVLFGMVAFAIDIGHIVHARTELQRTADSCALAAVIRLPALDDSRLAAINLAEHNQGMVGLELEQSDVQFGYWDRVTATFSTSSSHAANAVRVTVGRTAARGNPLPLFFASLIGTSSADVTASATAMYDHGLCGPFVAVDWLSVPGTATTDSFNSDNGPYDPLAAGSRGSICSDGPITLEGTITINGDARAGKGTSVTLEGTPTITGSQGNRIKPLNLPPVDATQAANGNNNNGNIPLIPKGNSWQSPVDSNGNFLLDGNNIYNLPPGTYYLNDFVLEGQSEFNVSGPTTIYLTGNLERSGGTTVNNLTQKAANLKIMMTGGTANVTSSNDFYGVLYAPNTDVTLAGTSHYFGAVVGKTLTATGQSYMHYDESLEFEEVDLPRRTALVD